MIILYLYIAFFVGVIVCAFFANSQLWDEKMKSYDEGWRAGYWIGYGEAYNDLDEDPRREHADEEIEIMRHKH